LCDSIGFLTRQHKRIVQPVCKVSDGFPNTRIPGVVCTVATVVFPIVVVFADEVAASDDDESGNAVEVAANVLVDTADVFNSDETAKLVGNVVTDGAIAVVETTLVVQ